MSDELVQVALECDETQISSDLSQPPISGHDFLKRVQLEASNYPDVVVAQNFLQKNGMPNQLPQSMAAPPGFCPSLEWQTEQVANFSVQRLSFEKYKQRIENGEITIDYLQFPRSKDVAGWIRYCFCAPSQRVVIEPHLAGEDVACSDDESEYDEDMADDDDSQSVGEGCVVIEASAESVGASEAHPPLLSTLAQLDQRTVINVIDYHVKWLEASGFTEHQGRWFYALLSALEKPLIPDACYLLRTLAKLCGSLRAALPSADDARLTPLNLIICLVARYFDQLDLADTG